MSEDPESFLQRESLVKNLMKMLNDVANSSKVESQGIKTKEEKVEDVEPGEDDLIVTSHFFTQQVGRSTRKSVIRKQMSANTNKFTFVRQFEEDPKKRADIRRELEFLANNFRSNGNHEFKLGKYTEAIHLYSSGLECIPDTPVLYCNRGLCYVKMANYKRAIIDFDFVINKLDQKCLRAWLYRAACYWRMNDEKNYQNSIDFARQYNVSNLKYINGFIKRMPTEL